MVYAGGKTPGKEGTITSVLDGKNIGIDGKIYMLIDERVAMVREKNYPVGFRVEYKRVSQKGPEEGKINFLGPWPEANFQPATAPAKAAKEPRTINGNYVGRTASQITVAEGDLKHVLKADLDLLAYIAKPDNHITSGLSVIVTLIDVGGEWIAKTIAPGPEGFKTEKEILEQKKKDEIPATDITGDELAAEIAVKQRAAEREHNEAMAKMSKEAAEKRKEDILPATLTKSLPPLVKEIPADIERPPVSGDPVVGPVEIGIHIDMGSYTNFDLKISELTTERALVRLEADAEKAIAMMRRLMGLSKKGY
ncbi:hypothetical protein CCP3SC15_420001 [Gammaproteobacteria bacterium]